MMWDAIRGWRGVVSVRLFEQEQVRTVDPIKYFARFIRSSHVLLP